MYKGRRILGLIPARGGSKKLPRKNVRYLLGKPLIVWTIEKALLSEYLDRAVVSTDNGEIAEVSRKYGAEVPFMRPKKLATDNSKVIDTVLHVLHFFAKKNLNFDYLALIEPTSPLRKDDDIDKAIKKLIDNEDIAESLVSLGEIVLEHPLYAKKIDESGYARSFLETGKVISLRQTLPKAYFPYGVIYIAKVSAIRKYRAVYPDRILPFFIERWQNYEVNDIWDFLCVESILKKREREK